MTEQWKDVPGYEGRYQVSNKGRVRNASGKFLSPVKHVGGYRQAHLYLGGKRTVVLIHRLVLSVFVSPPSAEQEGNHINFDRTDNRVENLEWVSHVVNVHHTINAGRRPQTACTKRIVGTSCTDGRTVRFGSQSAAEKHFSGRNTGAISSAFRKGRNTVYGFTWVVV